MSVDLCQDLGSLGCQNAGSVSPTQTFSPFEGDPRGQDKTRIVKWLTYHPEGVSVARTTKALFPSSDHSEISDRDYSNTDYRFVRRFFEHSDYVNFDPDADVLQGFPRPDAFHLTQESKIPTDHRPSFAKDRAKSLTRGIWSLNDVNDARLLAKDFVTYLDSIHNRRLMLEESDRSDLRITMPYHTRFNNDHRKNEQWARYNQAWELADEKYDRGVMLTLTTDPNRYDSIAAMVVGLIEAWQDLHESLNQRYLDDTRLDFIRALEFGGSEKSSHIGLPHLHVVVFGVPYIDHGWLKRYWKPRQGEIVHIHGMNKRGSDSWVLHGGEHAGKSVAGYLGKYLSKTFEAIGDHPEDLRAEYESWEEGGDWANSELWKLALYWATGRQFWSSSHDLKGESKPDRLEDIDGLGETKFERLREEGIQTLSDVRLADTAEIAAVEGISKPFAERMKELVGEPSEFDVYQFEFVGAASWTDMPMDWTASARHMGVQTATG